MDLAVLEKIFKKFNSNEIISGKRRPLGRSPRTHGDDGQIVHISFRALINRFQLDRRSLSFCFLARRFLSPDLEQPITVD